MADQSRGYDLLHPIYLDVPMMISFLAHIQGGVATSEEQKRTTSEASQRVARFGARLGIRFPWVGQADVDAKAEAQRSDDTSVESTAQRHHTEASLFNLLYQYLLDDDQVTAIGGQDKLSELKSGQLVEISGDYRGNPIEDVLAYAEALLPYYEAQKGAQRDALDQEIADARKAKKSANPAKKSHSISNRMEIESLEDIRRSLDDPTEKAGLDLMARMIEDIKAVPVHDLLFRSRDGLEAVLTVSSNYYSSDTNEYLRAGQFRVVGKVSRVVPEGEELNLTRRTVVGAAEPGVAQEMLDSFQNSGDNDLNEDAEGIHLDVPKAIVNGPVIQILPMAVFI